VSIDEQQPPQDPDACPNCGHSVTAVLTYGVSAGRPATPDRQQTVCPNCGTRVRRRVGYAWRAVEEEE
jgi:hypothetical protein